MKTHTKAKVLAPAPVLAALLLGVLDVQSALAAPWINTSPLNVGRNSHTTTLLLNGQLLIAGGIANNGFSTNNSELYDPVTGSTRTTGSMLSARQWHTATLLLNGKVLVAGGANGTLTLTSADRTVPRWLR